MPRVSAATLLALAVTSIAGAFVYDRRGPAYLVNHSPSAPRGIYRITERTPTVGDWAAVPTDSLPTPWDTRFASSDYLIKRIVALSGDHVQTAPGGTWVNGERVGAGCPRCALDRVIEESAAFVHNPAPRSRDAHHHVHPGEYRRPEGRRYRRYGPRQGRIRRNRNPRIGDQQLT